MRVYLPSTLPGLAAILRNGRIPAGPAYMVTPGLREAYASGDQEELEYVALTLAARMSLRLLAADPAAAPRRVVLAAEVSAAAILPTTEAGSVQPAAEVGAIVLAGPVPLADVVSAHVDDEQAGPDIQAAIAALPAADAGDDDAMFTVDGAEGHELGWYATQEFRDLAG